MSIKVFFSAFNIDDTKRKWLVRFLFVVLSVLVSLAILFPVGDPDLEKNSILIEKMMNGEVDPFTTDFTPLVDNAIYLLSIEALTYLVMCISVVSAAAFIYGRRKIKTKEHRKKIIRNTILALLMLLVIFPMFYSLYVNFYLLFALAAVYVSIIGCCFVSGDYSFGASFGKGFRFVKKNAPTCIVNFILMFILFYTSEYVIEALKEGHAYMTILAGLAGPLEVYKNLVFGRMVASIYVFGEK